MSPITESHAGKTVIEDFSVITGSTVCRQNDGHLSLGLSASISILIIIFHEAELRLTNNYLISIQINYSKY